jgi:hypothetical protein
MPEPLLIGTIYHETAPGRWAPAPQWELRDRLTAKLTQAKDTAWDTEHERAAAALLDVLDWHRPWQRWEQVFDPTYIGDRYLGTGCRSCNWSAATPCPTVQAIATAFGIS